MVWTDTAPDPSDPRPGDNPQVTRKTVTRVTTKSGFGDLPPASDPCEYLKDNNQAGNVDACNLADILNFESDKVSLCR